LAHGTYGSKGIENILMVLPPINFSVDSDLLSCRVKPELRENINSFVAALRV
jgi:hypothetical protein